MIKQEVFLEILSIIYKERKLAFSSFFYVARQKLKHLKMQLFYLTNSK